MSGSTSSSAASAAPAVSLVGDVATASITALGCPCARLIASCISCHRGPASDCGIAMTSSMAAHELAEPLFAAKPPCASRVLAGSNVTIYPNWRRWSPGIGRITAGQRRDEDARLEQAASGGEREAPDRAFGVARSRPDVTALEPIHQARLRDTAVQAAEDALRSCSCLGGLPLVPAPIKRCSFMLLLQSNQILLDCRPRPSYELPWDAVRDVEVRHTDRVAERVTATRVATLGIFAWAAKKQRKKACSFCTGTMPWRISLFAAGRRSSSRRHWRPSAG
jgi:hypothetical protein